MEKTLTLNKGESQGIFLEDSYTYKINVAGGEIKKNNVKVEYKNSVTKGERMVVFTNCNDSPVFIDIIKK